MYATACAGDWTPCLVHHSCIALLARVPTLLAVSTCSACSVPLRLQVNRAMHSCILIMVVELVVLPCSACGASDLNCSSACLSLSMTSELSISASSSSRREVDILIPVLVLLSASLFPASCPIGVAGVQPILGPSLVCCVRTRSLATTNSAPLSVAMCSCIGACRYWYRRIGGPLTPTCRAMTLRVCTASSEVWIPCSIHHDRNAVSASWPLSAAVSASLSCSQVLSCVAHQISGTS